MKKDEKGKPWLSGLLSLVIPGLGQIYCGEKDRGALIIFGAVVVANLNVLILPLISMANPRLPPVGPRAAWAYWIPRIVHDVSSLWSLAYWVWAVVDAVLLAKVRRRAR